VEVDVIAEVAEVDVTDQSNKLTYEEVSVISSKLFYESLDVEQKLRYNAEDRQEEPGGGYSSKTARETSFEWYENQMRIALEGTGWTLEDFRKAEEEDSIAFYEALNYKLYNYSNESEIIHEEDDEPEEIDLQ
jgi:predicted nucleic acid-binding Zn ribbon protein